MSDATPLPERLLEGYREWTSGAGSRNASLMRKLADLANGQSPTALVVSCCDSRVLATMLFQAEPGDLFMHRNIANLVPALDDAKAGPGLATAAAIEYAVAALRVPHAIVIGHSGCGGVKGCDAMCAGSAPELDDAASLVGAWVRMLRPARERVAHINDETERLRALEREGVALSLENLRTYPVVRDAVAAEDLALHGLWHDIGAGSLERLDPETKAWTPL